MKIPHIVVTAGEPAGIGPDIVLKALASDHSFDAAISVACDPGVLTERARGLGLDMRLRVIQRGEVPPVHRSGEIHVIPAPVAEAVSPGRLNPKNAGSVVESINTATDLCLQTVAAAMVTAPVHKAVINDGGFHFQGHTEWIAERSGGALPVMMLASPSLRVCLATTHLPLCKVPQAITRELLTRILEIIDADIGRLYGLAHPVIGVLGLNPHAGEGGYLGCEEIDTIIPVLESLRRKGLRLAGPLPADTAFTTHQLEQLDVVLAMYHDQGLPVIKHRGFGEVVNVTLGIPVIRTSVDHGTALDLAGTGDASESSLVSAIRLATSFADGKNRNRPES